MSGALAAEGGKEMLSRFSLSRLRALAGTGVGGLPAARSAAEKNANAKHRLWWGGFRESDC